MRSRVWVRCGVEEAGNTFDVFKGVEDRPTSRFVRADFTVEVKQQQCR